MAPAAAPSHALTYGSRVFESRFLEKSNDENDRDDKNHSVSTIMTMTAEALYAILPLLPPAWLLIRLLDNPIPIVQGWIDLLFASRHEEGTPREIPRVPTVGSQLLAYLTMAIFGYIATYRLVPNIKKYTLRKGICGKDLGKRGTSTADKEM